MNLKAKYLNNLCWLFLALFYLYENILQVSQNILTPIMQTELNMQDHQLSMMLSAYFWGYAFMQIPVGVILDKYGVKKPLLVAVMMCNIGAVILSSATSFLVAVIARVFIGLGSAFAVLSALNFTAENFGKHKFATLTGLLLTVGMSGQILGEAPLQHLVNLHGWRASLQIIAIFGVFIFIVLQLFIPRDKNKTGASDKIDLKKLVYKIKPWIISIYGMLRFTPFLLFVSFWGNPFMTNIYKLSPESSAIICGMLPLGFAFGAPIWGKISDLIGKRKPIVIISNFLEIMFWYLLTIKLNLMLTEIVAFLLGFAVSGFLPAFSLMKESVELNIRTTAMGFMNTLNAVGTPIFMPMIMIIKNNYSYKNALMVFPLIAICAIIVGIFLKDVQK